MNILEIEARHIEEEGLTTEIKDRLLDGKQA
jgi:hypothetical protein